MIKSAHKNNEMLCRKLKIWSLNSFVKTTVSPYLFPFCTSEQERKEIVLCLASNHSLNVAYLGVQQSTFLSHPIYLKMEREPFSEKKCF